MLLIIRFFLCFPTLLKEPDVGMPERDAHRFFLQLISSVVGEANLRDEAVSSANFSYHLIHSCTLTGISPQCWHHPQRYQTRKHFAG